MKGTGLTLGVGYKDQAPVPRLLQVSRPQSTPDSLGERGVSQLCHLSLDSNHWCVWRGDDDSLSLDLVHLVHRAASYTHCGYQIHTWQLQKIEESGGQKKNWAVRAWNLLLSPS